MRKIPYADRLKQWRHAKNAEICKCPKKDCDLLQKDLAKKSQVNDGEAELEWFTNVVTVDHELSLVISEIEAAELLTVKNLN